MPTTLSHGSRTRRPLRSRWLLLMLGAGIVVLFGGRRWWRQESGGPGRGIGSSWSSFPSPPPALHAITGDQFDAGMDPRTVVGGGPSSNGTRNGHPTSTSDENSSSSRRNHPLLHSKLQQMLNQFPADDDIAEVELEETRLKALFEADANLNPAVGVNGMPTAIRNVTNNGRALTVQP